MAAIDERPDKEHIERCLRDGMSTRSVARTFGLHQTTVARHLRRMRAQDEQRRRESDAKMRDPDFVVEQLRLLYNVATAAARRASESKSSAVQIQAQREARQTLKEIERLLDKQRAQATATSGVPPHVVQRALIDALRPYPEAREAVVEALDKLEARHART